MPEPTKGSPYTQHPAPIRLFNQLGPTLDWFGLLPRLDANELMERAAKKTGLEDFGEDWFREPLEILIHSMNAEARLSVLGQTIMHKRLLDALTIRLRAERLLKAHPEILEQDLGHVFVIAGLQRTGTTLLHRLMGSNPRFKAPLSWEVLGPVPLESELRTFEKSGTWPAPHGRIRQARLAERGLKYIAPQFFAIHPVEHDMPEEDVLLLDVSFMSQSAEATMHVPTYASWLEAQDATPAYRYLKTLLKILVWRAGADHIVLKSPHHMEHLDTIAQVFPGATVIQTHRDPQKTLASFVSMVCHGAGIFSEHVNPLDFSDHWREKVKLLLERSGKARAAGDADRFIDIQYADLVAEPISELARIYDKAGLPFDDSAKQHAAALLERQIKNKYGQHHYDAETFELTHETLEQDFGVYRREFNIPLEGAEHQK